MFMFCFIYYLSLFFSLTRFRFRPFPSHAHISFIARLAISNCHQSTNGIPNRVVMVPRISVFSESSHTLSPSPLIPPSPSPRLSPVQAHKQLSTSKILL